MSGRKLWIDLFKSLGIFFVAIGHIATGRVVNIIYSFHMPLFVVLSGYNAYFSRNKIYDKSIFKNIFVSMIRVFPVILFLNLFKIISGLIVNGLSIENLKTYIKLMNNSNFSYIFNQGNIKLPFAGATWFLIHLIFVQAMHKFFVSKFKDREFERFILIVFVFILSIPNNFSTFRYLPMNFNSSLVSLLYYEIGYLFHKYENYIIQHIKIKYPSSKYIFSLLVALFFMFYVSTLNVGISLRTLEYGNHVYATLTTIFIPILLMLIFIELEDVFKKIPFMEYFQILGKNALYVLGIDSSIKYVLVSFYPFLLLSRSNRIILIMIVVLIMTLIANLIELSLKYSKLKK